MTEKLKLSSFNLIGGEKFITLQLNGGYDFISFTRYNDNNLSYDSFKYNLSFCLRSSLKDNHIINYHFNDIKIEFQDLEEFGLIQLIFKCESIVTLHDIELSFSDKRNSLLILDFLESVRDIILSDKGEFSLDLDHVRDIVNLTN